MIIVHVCAPVRRNQNLHFPTLAADRREMRSSPAMVLNRNIVNECTSDALASAECERKES